MVKLFEVNEQNWRDVVLLRVHESQEKFLDSAGGILMRGYIYRSLDAKVIGIAADGQTVGVALVKVFGEEPVWYDLQQFMIDRRFQNRGYGTEALRLILATLRKEGKYPCVEACVDQKNTAALRMFHKTGFSETGYTNEDCPDSLSLAYHFASEHDGCTDALISDFSAPLFGEMFRQYFSELGITVKDWPGLFSEMNAEGDNLAFARTAQDGSPIGFIQFKPITFTSWFFEEPCGFIREFWIAETYRSAGHGSALLALAEKHFAEKGICMLILTTDTAEEFYRKHGYRKIPECKAKNHDAVMGKRLQ